jgi:hypothetical protein
VATPGRASARRVAGIDQAPDSAHNPSPRPPKGVELGDMLILFAKQKLVISSKAVGTNEHLTLHFGPTSKILDLHKTYTATDGTKTHETLFEISHGNLECMMQDLAGPFIESLMGLARPLTLEYMEKHGIGAIVGPLPTQDNLAATIDKHKGRITINNEKLAVEYHAPQYIDELYGLEEGKIFILISRARRRNARRIGFGFPVTDQRNRRRLVWIPDKELADQFDRMSVLLQSAAGKFGVVHGQRSSKHFGSRASPRHVAP